MVTTPTFSRMQQECAETLSHAIRAHSSTLNSEEAEKLGEAIQTLALHPAGIKGRLRAAALPLAAVNPMVLPMGIRRQFKQLVREMTSKSKTLRAKELGALSATLYRMHESTAVRIATRLYSIEGEFASRLRDGRR